MILAAKAVIALVAIFHLYVLWIEMFAWESRGPKVFRMIPKDMFAPTKAMMANQGLYNGFLAAGLIWALIAAPDRFVSIATFFLACVAIAGIFGAMTASRRIFYVQALPALIGLALVWLG
jgi:putative membrane protein